MKAMKVTSITRYFFSEVLIYIYIYIYANLRFDSQNGGE